MYKTWNWKHKQSSTGKMPIVTVLLRFKVSTCREDAVITESCISVAGLVDDDEKEDFENDLNFHLEDDVLMNTAHFDDVNSSSQRSGSTKNKKPVQSQLKAIIFAKVTECLNHLETLGFEIFSSTVDSIELKDHVEKTHLWTLKAPPKPKIKDSDSDSDDAPPTFKRSKMTYAARKRC